MDPGMINTIPSPETFEIGSVVRFSLAIYIYNLILISDWMYMIAPTNQYHFFIPSPLGWIATGLTSRGEVERLSINRVSNADKTMILGTSAPRHSRILGFLKNQIDGYFQLQCRTFNIPLVLSGNGLEEQVWNELLTLQFGQCVDLSVICHRVGSSNPGAVARAIRANPIAILIPSHRVLGWENVTPAEDSIEWLNRLRALEDIVPGESTCMMYSSLPTTALELARSAALAPPAHFNSNEPRKASSTTSPAYRW
jgi:O6-methylguanine-DNA--protein-cysteine methyltransferase